MKALSLAIQKIWPMLKFFHTDRRTGQKLYAPDLLIWGHKNLKLESAMFPFQAWLSKITWSNMNT
jgi:hypothetical protein